MELGNGSPTRRGPGGSAAGFLYATRTLGSFSHSRLTAAAPSPPGSHVLTLR